MDAAGPGLALFQTCLTAFQLVTTAAAASKDFSRLQTKLRIEEARLIILGRTWGFVPNEPDKLREGARNVAGTVRPLVQTSTLGTGEWIFRLVEEILEQILDILLDKDRLTQRYGLSFEQNSVPKTQDVQNAIIRPIRRYFPWLQGRAVDQTHADEIPNLILAKRKQLSALRQLRWAVVDKEAFSTLVVDLQDLNTGLERLVSPRDTANISAQLLAHFSTVRMPAELDELKRASEDYLQLQQSLDLRSFEMQLDTESGPDKTAGTIRFENLIAVIPLESFEAGKSISRYRCPNRQRSFPVVIDWKEYASIDLTSTTDKIRDPRKRIHRLARLLEHAGAHAEPKNLRVLELLACVDDPKQSRIGYIFRQPGIDLEPISLRTLLDSGSTEVPELGQRYSLALSLSRSVMQLHASRWLHKGLRSSNVLIFSPPQQNKPLATDTIDISSPWLLGFEYARPDTEAEATESLLSYSPEHDLYRHPASIKALGAANPVTDHYRREFDVYALGCVLLEIGLWTPMKTFWKDKYRAEEFRTRLLRSHVRLLGSRCGARYQSAVEFCLRGGGQVNGVGEDGGGSLDVNLRMFYENVVGKVLACCD